MDEQQKQAIEEFFKASSELTKLGIVRSSDFIGDIAEFVCASLYGVKLSSSLREESLDGIDKNGRKVEIKYHGGVNRNNIQMDKYKAGNFNFEDLIIILGLRSKIRPSSVQDNTYPVYRIQNYQGGNIAKGVLDRLTLDFLLDEKFNVINLNKSQMLKQITFAKRPI